MPRLRSLLLLLSTLTPLMSACHEPEAHAEARATYAVTTPLRRDTELTTKYVAQVHAIQHIELRALERGYLQDIFVDEGQQIREGQKMFQIMPLIYQAEVNRAQAEVDLERIEYENAKLLADHDVIAPSELALAKAKYNKAKAELGLSAAHKSLTQIHAPFDGIMGRFQVRKGSLVDEGELLTTLSDNSTVWIYFNVSEAQYLEYEASADAADVVTVRFELANGELFEQEGKIETIEADFNNETGNIAFRAGFANPDGLLRHGETGNILMIEPVEGALLIPQKATFEILDRQYVFVVDDGGTVHQREIHVAAELPHVYVVDAGLEETDRILLEGLRKVRDGDQIDVQFEQPAEVFADLDLHAE